MITFGSTRNTGPDPVHVAVAAISDARGHVLISRRPQHVHQGGVWEFPGGKVEPGETLIQALERELWEELGIRVVDSEPLIRVLHHYPDCSVLLDVQRVTAFAGVPEGREGQPWRWVSPQALAGYSFPLADRPIIAALRLPDRYLITGDDPLHPEDFIARLERALARGIRLVQFRAKSLPRDAYWKLACRAAESCRRWDAKLVLNGPLQQSRCVQADGIHLTSEQLMMLSERPLDATSLVGASCHNRIELAQADRLGLDFVVLSPVQPTSSHPKAMALGWEGFQYLTDQTRTLVYALGGMGPADLRRARQAGAQGIAAIRGLWPGA